MGGVFRTRGDGLYEFVWTINSASPEMPIDARFELACEAFVQLLGQEREWGEPEMEVVVVELRWPSIFLRLVDEKTRQ